MTYKNPRLKHVKKIKDICHELEMRCAVGGYTSQILNQCNLLLETKKKKKSKYSLPNEKEILGMLDGLTIIVRK